jgi:RNA polymerase sigma factor (sigma-70 family)
MDDNSRETALDVEPDLSLLEDPALLDLVRAGHSDAYAVLFARYRHAAHRLARYLSNSVDANDIVAESFTQVFHQLRQGRGPDESFRAYLFTSIRREAGRRAKSGTRVMPTDDMSRIDRPIPFGDGEYDGFEREIARSAYESLPQRWRMVLWHIDVEGAKPHELAAKLGLKANTVSALVYRAREGLRKAYLQQHVAVPKEHGPSCHDILPRIAGLVRETAAEREQVLVEAHLETCADCRGARRELELVNHQLGSVTGMVALAFAAPAAAATAGGIAAKSTVAVKSILALVGSSAAVFATSVVVIQIPSATPADAGTAEIQTVRLTPQQECMRAKPPESDRESQARDQAVAHTLQDSAASMRPAATAEPSSSSSSSPSSSPRVSVDLDQGQASVSVDTPVVKAEVDVDLHEPITSTVTDEPEIDVPVLKNAHSTTDAELQRQSAPVDESDSAPEPSPDSDGSPEG